MRWANETRSRGIAVGDRAGNRSGGGIASGFRAMAQSGAAAGFRRVLVSVPAGLDAKEGGEGKEAMLPQRNVLLMMDSGYETRDVQEFLRDHTALTCVRTLGELRVHLGRGRYDAVLCGRSFRSGSWREILKAADEEAPGVPTIVLSNDGSGREWREAVGAGAFDLVTLPVPQHTLLGILEQAAASQQARSRWTQPTAAEVVPA